VFTKTRVQTAGPPYWLDHMITNNSSAREVQLSPNIHQKQSGDARWGSLQRSPDSLAGFEGGPPESGGVRRGKEGMGKWQK